MISQLEHQEITGILHERQENKRLFKSGLILVLNLIDREGGLSFLDNRRVKLSKTKVIMDYFRRSIENSSKKKDKKKKRGRDRTSKQLKYTPIFQDARTKQPSPHIRHLLRPKRVLSWTYGSFDIFYRTK